MAQELFNLLEPLYTQGFKTSSKEQESKKAMV